MRTVRILGITRGALDGMYNIDAHLLFSGGYVEYSFPWYSREAIDELAVLKQLQKYRRNIVVLF